MEELMDGSDGTGLFDSSRDTTSLCDSWQIINFKMKETMQIKNDCAPLVAQKPNQRAYGQRQQGIKKKPTVGAKQAKGNQKQIQIKIGYQSRNIKQLNSPFMVAGQGVGDRQKPWGCKAVDAIQPSTKNIIINANAFPLKAVIKTLQTDTKGRVEQQSLSKQSRAASYDKEQKKMNPQSFLGDYQKSSSFHFAIRKLSNIDKKKGEMSHYESRQYKFRSQYLKPLNGQIQNDPSNLYLNCSKSQNLYPTFAIHHSPDKSLSKLRLFGQKQRVLSLQNMREKQKIHRSILGLQAERSTKAKEVNNRQRKQQIKISFGPVVTKLKIIRNQKQ